LALLRILVGFGLAAITPALTIVVELTPTRWRTGMTSLFVLTASLGPLLASPAPPYCCKGSPGAGSRCWASCRS
jgi:MFS family permease